MMTTVFLPAKTLCRALWCCARMLIILLLLSAAARAQYRFDSWTTDSGLPQNSVNSILQTSDGYLWFTTLDGVVRYDGVQFRIFDKGNSRGILSNRFYSLLEDGEGALWIATEDSGVTRYKDGAFTTYTTSDGLATNLIHSLRLDRSGVLLVRTRAGEGRWQGDRFVTDTAPTARAADNSIYCAGKESLWFYDQTGLHRIRDGRQTLVATGAKELSPSCLYEDRQGTLWLGTMNGQLWRFREGKFARQPFQLKEPNSDIKVMLEDRQGNLWFGTSGAGLGCYRNGGLTLYSTAEGLSDKVILSLFEDREGTLWIGTGNQGINRLRRQIIAVYSSREGLNADSIYTIYEDRKGVIWLGGLGLNRLSAGKLTTYTSRNGLDNYSVTSLYEDREGRLWIGAVAGLSYLKDGAFVSLNERLPLPPHNFSIWAIHQEPGGALWFGSDQGLVRYADEQMTLFTTKDGLPDNDVKWIHQDRNGRLWFATYGGLSYLQDGKFIALGQAEGLFSLRLRTIHEDDDGTLWIGSYDGGLSRLKDGRFTNYTTADGLFSNGVFQILDDQRGNFWIGSNRGIYRVSREQLNAFAEGRVRSLTCVSYGKEDGLLNTECNGGRQPAGLRDSRGRLWVATQGGAAVIDVASLAINPLPPSVVIEEVMVDREAAGFNDAVQIAAGRENLEIHYTGLSFIKPEYVRFRYRMEGLDRDWVEAGNRRAAYYPYLPPGNYTFTVIAANSDGIWSDRERRLQIIVLPPFWQTWPFILLLAGLATLLVWLIYRRRVSALRRAHAAQQAFSRQLIASQEAERKRIAGELHDSLGQNLLVIKNWALLGLSAMDEADRGHDELQEIATAASQSIGEVREISYNLRPHLLDEVGLTEALKAMVKRVAAASAVHFESEIDPIDRLFAKETEIGIYRIVQEAINNILRHAEATRAEIIVRRDIHTLLLEISDNGKGIAPTAGNQSGAGGFGLTGMGERARLLGGRFAVHSTAGQGTRIEVRLTIERADHEE
jgi:ligand-binding sensor domain-containing protein/signal transduction histidine kinase